ncbi:MAG: hypothetical protein GEV06_23385 [Luteitalea sp.]|nr:hypothetical protein [Luteitalea sp.]
MRVLSALRRDHYDIEAMLAVFEAAARRLQEGRYVGPEMLAGILRFFRQSVCECHHEKEEAGLFPLLLASRREAELVCALTAQHATHRAMFEQTTQKLKLLQQKDAGARGTFIVHVRECVASVREHVGRENRLFDETVAALLTAAQDEELSSTFGSIERVTIGPTGREWYNQVVADYRDIVSTLGQVA